MFPVQQPQLNEIVEFVKPHYKDAPDDVLREVISKHMEYGTIAHPKDEVGEFYGVAVWNIKGLTAYIEQVVVNPKYERGKVLKFLISLGWSRFKWVKYIAFERRHKKHDKGMRFYKITRFF